MEPNLNLAIFGLLLFPVMVKEYNRMILEQQYYKHKRRKYTQREFI